MRVPASLILSLLVCAALAPSASAQEAAWGVKGGVNFATLRSDADGEEDPGYRIGLVAGGFYTWPLNGRLAVQPEVLFSQQGSSLTEDAFEFNVKLDYLSIPVLVRYNLTSAARPIFVFGGPSFAFKVRAKASSGTGGTTIEDDISDSVETLDLGVVAGGGMQFGRYSVDGRYTWGLSNVDADDTAERTVHSHTISVMAGIRF